MKDKPALPTSTEITRRLQIVTELRNLCLSLGRARRAGYVEGQNAACPPDVRSKQDDTAKAAAPTAPLC